jgi:hypothetical protein
MANNRMYLVHKPTGHAVYLGKRFLGGYYDAPENLSKQVQKLFDLAEESKVESQDDFCVVFESKNDATCAMDSDDIEMKIIQDGDLNV